MNFLKRFLGGHKTSSEPNMGSLRSRPTGFVAGEELGLLFDIDGLKTSSYGDKAWRLICASVHPTELQPSCYFFLGDVDIPVRNKPYAFCIGIGVAPLFSNDASPLEVFAKKFWVLDDPGIAPRQQRFIRGKSLQKTHSLYRCVSLFRIALS